MYHDPRPLGGKLFISSKSILPLAVLGFILIGKVWY